jgi:hypothetical protein
LKNHLQNLPDHGPKQVRQKREREARFKAKLARDPIEAAHEKAAQEAMKEAVEKGRVFKAKDLNDKRVTIYRLEEDPF